MLDFLFITSPTNARNPHPPYYFLYLASYLRNKGLNIELADIKGGDRPIDIDNHLNQLSTKLRSPEYKSKFIGLAAFHSDYSMIIRMGKLIKECQPETILLVGNAHATINPEDFIYEESPFDIAILGEGEETCWELNNQHSVKEIVKGICYYDSFKNEIVKTEPRQFIKAEQIYQPAYDLIDMDYYLKPQKLIIRRIYTSMIAIFAGRGCPFNCDFCCANAVWKANKGKAARLRPVIDVIREIQDLVVKYDLDFFYLFDDMFGMDKEWMKEWFKKKDFLDAWNGKQVPYACQTRADVATEDMVRGLKESGCIQLDIGVESGSQKLLDKVNKKITLDQIRRVFKWCRKYKIRSFATMLLNLPEETEQDLKETKEFLEEIKPTAGMIFGVTTPYPGTKIYEDYCKQKLKKEEYDLLIDNRLNPIERFRMASHNKDLEKIWDKFNRHFKATPMFERMWCMNPFQKLYWQTVLKSKRRWQYIRLMAKDLFKTFILYWLHKLRIYRFVKIIQYGRKWCKK